MSQVLSKPVAPRTTTASGDIPPLVNGDRLSRAEFERRYIAMPDVNKAQLIEGIVFMPSPVRYHAHGKPHVLLSGWLCNYIAKTPGLADFGDNGTVRLDEDNEPQPDLFLLLPPALGGRAKVDADDYIAGPPTLVCEIAASSVNIDLHLKKNAYRRNGVREYLVWRTEESAFDWFELIGGEFVPIAPDAEGILKSRVFPGLWLNPATLLAADLPAAFALLDRAAASAEHAEFVRKLAGSA
jgi:hypothetical protein